MTTVQNNELPKLDHIIFNPENHTYHDREGFEYNGWTKVSNTLKIPFDRAGISRRMAAGIAKGRDVSVDAVQEVILEEWESKRLSSEIHGNSIHDKLEHFSRVGEFDHTIKDVVSYLVNNILKDAYRYYPEFLIFSRKYRKAGTADLVVQRQKGWKSSLFDIFDYKTNEQKGIVFDSIHRKNGIKHYNRFLLPPFDYIEDCNFALYSLQLMAYAYMLSEMYSIRIGRLGIIFVSADGQPTMYPVLYNPGLIEQIFTHYNNLQHLPIISDRLF